MTTRAHLVLGLGFGDEGKGTIVDWLARRAATPPLIVRWNGGPQAAHHVVTPAGHVHCFAQLGSGSFVDGTRTHLAAEMAVDPYALHVESSVLARAGVADAVRRVTIDPRAVLVTPWHAIVNQVRELLRGDGRHGSTGRGVYEAKLGRARITAGALLDPGFIDALDRLREQLAATARGLLDAHRDPPEDAIALVDRAADRDLFDTFHDAARAIARAAITTAPPPAADIIFEGAQGALLDRDHGFFPYVTPSWVTRDAAARVANELGVAQFETWGVLRAFHTRHGAGPFPSESATLAELVPEPHNPPGVAGRFRVGWFDGVLARFALGFAGPIDRLAVTSLDRTAHFDRVVAAWTDNDQSSARPSGRVGETPDNNDLRDLAAIPAAQRTELAMTARPVLATIDRDYPRALEALVGRRIDLESWGPTADDKQLR